MPELPEVETFRRTILKGAMGKVIIDAKVDGIKILPESLPEVSNGLIGKTIIGSKRNGKTLFLELNDKRWLLLHFGMSGLPEFYNHEVPRFARLTITFEDVCLAICWQRRLGAIALIEDPEAYLIAKGRGEDALDIGLQEFCNKIQGKRVIKSILLDQSSVSGVGNLYADEMLFQNGLRPDRKADTLTKEEICGLHESMIRILRLSIDKETNVSLFPDDMMLKYRSKKSYCPKCNGNWTIQTVAGRTSYYCEHCQK